ncbi:MAG: hypothetical protein U0K19_01855, partial [Bifidobacteriaceae bacterium]|nr:hypothetical protein [Bifidobacteriaceae bacterium]
ATAPPAATNPHIPRSFTYLHHRPPAGHSPRKPAAPSRPAIPIVRQNTQKGGTASDFPLENQSRDVFLYSY